MIIWLSNFDLRVQLISLYSLILQCVKVSFTFITGECIKQKGKLSAGYLSWRKEGSSPWLEWMRKNSSCAGTQANLVNLTGCIAVRISLGHPAGPQRLLDWPPVHPPVPFCLVKAVSQHVLYLPCHILSLGIPEEKAKAVEQHFKNSLCVFFKPNLKKSVCVCVYEWKKLREDRSI